MAESRDCPLCGDVMHLKERSVAERIPGRTQVVARVVREWICPGCDYYEEEEDERRSPDR